MTQIPIATVSSGQKIAEIPEIQFVLSQFRKSKDADQKPKNMEEIKSDKQESEHKASDDQKTNTANSGSKNGESAGKFKSPAVESCEAISDEENAPLATDRTARKRIIKSIDLT